MIALLRVNCSGLFLVATFIKSDVQKIPFGKYFKHYQQWQNENKYIFFESFNLLVLIP